MAINLHALHSSSPHFRWDTFNSDDRKWLEGRTDHILTLAYRSACDIVRIGRAIEDVRGKLPRKHYRAWVITTLPFSLKTAKRYRRVAEVFGPYESLQFEVFDPCALYVFSQLTCPQAAREHAVREAEQGKRITLAVAKEILSAYKPMRLTEREEGRLVGQLQKRMGGIRRDEAEARAKQERTVDPKVIAARWEVLAELIDSCSMITIQRVEDTEECHEPAYSITYYHAGESHTVVQRRLHNAILTAAGKEETKWCPSCNNGVGGEKPVSLFSACRLSPDLLMHECKVCAKERKQTARAAAKAKIQPELPECATADAPAAIPILAIPDTSPACPSPTRSPTPSSPQTLLG